MTERKLRTYVTATLLTAAAGQLASTGDAVAVAQFVDTNAVSVLSLMMPLTVAISCLALLLGFGANALFARAIGQNNEREASRILSTAVMSLTAFGILTSLFIWWMTPEITASLTNDESMLILARDYLSVYAWAAWLEMLSYGLCLFVASEGHPMRVSASVAIGVAVNIVADVILMGYLDMGIRGAAIGSILQFICTTLLLSVWLCSDGSQLRMLWPFKGFLGQLLANTKEGVPITLGSLLMAVTLLLINNITYNALGVDGLFFWSVCLQMLLVAFIFINGTTEALFAIGEVLVGAGRRDALKSLFRKSLLITCGMIAVLMMVMAIPDAVAIAFGVEDEPMLTQLTDVLRIFSLMMIPFAVAYLSNFALQIQGRVVLSAMMLVGQLLWTLLVVWQFSLWVPSLFWWAFPLSGMTYLLIQIIFIYEHIST